MLFSFSLLSWFLINPIFFFMLFIYYQITYYIIISTSIKFEYVSNSRVHEFLNIMYSPYWLQFLFQRFRVSIYNFSLSTIEDFVLLSYHPFQIGKCFNDCMLYKSTFIRLFSYRCIKNAKLNLIKSLLYIQNISI